MAVCCGVVCVVDHSDLAGSLSLSITGDWKVYESLIDSVTRAAAAAAARSTACSAY